MTKEELVAELTNLAETCRGDPEAAHVQADEALLRFIDDPDVVAAWDRVPKWYA